MALSITRESKIPGINVTYFKVVELNINWHSKSAKAQVNGWRDDQDRIDHPLQPLFSQYYDFELNVPAELSNHPAGKQTLEFCFSPESNVTADTYTALKTLPEWSGSTDV